MSQDASKIFAGPARIFAAITNPASGTPPTWMTHTAGVPTPGSDIGYTQGACMFEYLAQTKFIDAEQSLAHADVMTISEDVKCSFTMLEHNYFALQEAFGNIGKLDDGTRTGFYAGGGTGILTPLQQSIMISAPRRDAPTKFEIAVIYKAVNIKGVVINYSRVTESIIAVELHGIADTTRNAGDTVMQFSREK